jgi:negative regulator of flagellin synthesis FlgM
MVESIKNLTKNIDVSKNSSTNSSKIDKLNTSSVSQKQAVDTVDLSGSLPTATLADFTKKAPIDVESVSKIKEAIANGEYPIDLDAVADMLLDAYKEMKS